MGPIEIKRFIIIKVLHLFKIWLWCGYGFGNRLYETSRPKNKFAKANSIAPKDMFVDLYETLGGKNRGPKMGKLIHAIGVEKIKKDLGI